MVGLVSELLSEVSASLLQVLRVVILPLSGTRRFIRSATDVNKIDVQIIGNLASL